MDFGFKQILLDIVIIAFQIAFHAKMVRLVILVKMVISLLLIVNVF